MAPTPQPTPRPVDIVPARSRPVLSVAVAIGCRGRSVYAYSASADAQRWSGTVEAESVDTAILDVIRGIRAASDVERIRFLVQLPMRSALWALRDEVALLMPGVWIERPRLSDEELVRRAVTGLRAVAVAPVCVATDGSVRGKFTG
jgi:hypothetical protein